MRSSHRQGHWGCGMSTGHTSGPWLAKREGFSTVYIEARIGGGMLQEIAACGPTAGGSDEQEANAELIASAPDLLAENDRLKALNAELVAALAVFVNKHDAAPDGQLGIGLINGDFGKARAALAKNKETT